MILVDMVCSCIFMAVLLSGAFCSKLRTDGGVAIALGGVVNCSVWIA